MKSLILALGVAMSMLAFTGTADARPRYYGHRGYYGYRYPGSYGRGYYGPRYYGRSYYYGPRYYAPYYGYSSGYYYPSYYYRTYPSVYFF
jgi:hypothetical protein